jgi:hypothetical protein
MITGRFPVVDLAIAKMCSRFGDRRAEIHPDNTNETAISRPVEKTRGEEEVTLSILTTS